MQQRSFTRYDINVLSLIKQIFIFPIDKLGNSAYNASTERRRHDEKCILDVSLYDVRKSGVFFEGALSNVYVLRQFQEYQ